jgi:4-hydroxy-tetrahydrodipicolinate synthase
MDVVGRYGGPCRPPRQPLLPDTEATIREITERLLASGYS